MPVASMLDPAILLPALPEAFRKLDPRLMIKNPVMFVVEVVTVLTTVLLVRDLATGAGGTRLLVPDRRSGSGSRCCSPTSPRPWPRAAARRRPPRCGAPAPRPRPSSWPRPRTATGARSRRSTLKPGDLVLVEAGDLIPSDGEIVEGVASVDESAITGESAPVIRESGGDRSAVTGGTRVLSDQILVRITAAPGLDLHRPHDRPGRGCRPAEDAQRDRAQHPARRHDADLRPGGGQHPELRRLRRRLDPGDRAGGPVRHPDPDHDRRPALGHRHRRHGPAGALQRAGHVRPRGRGRGRRRHAAARQDRHDHAGQPPGDRADRHAGRGRPGAGRRRAARELPRRDARGPLDRRAGQGEVRPARARDGAACTRASSRSPPRPG